MPNKLEVSADDDCPKVADPNGFLLAFSDEVEEPRPLKNPPPDPNIAPEAEVAVFELTPKSEADFDTGAFPKIVPLEDDEVAADEAAAAAKIEPDPKRGVLLELVVVVGELTVEPPKIDPPDTVVDAPPPNKLDGEVVVDPPKIDPLDAAVVVAPKMDPLALGFPKLPPEEPPKIDPPAGADEFPPKIDPPGGAEAVADPPKMEPLGAVVVSIEPPKMLPPAVAAEGLVAVEPPNIDPLEGFIVDDDEPPKIDPPELEAAPKMDPLGFSSVVVVVVPKMVVPVAGFRVESDLEVELLVVVDGVPNTESVVVGAIGLLDPPNMEDDVFEPKMDELEEDPNIDPVEVVVTTLDASVSDVFTPLPSTGFDSETGAVVEVFRAAPPKIDSEAEAPPKIDPGVVALVTAVDGVEAEAPPKIDPEVVALVAAVNGVGAEAPPKIEGLSPKPDMDVGFGPWPAFPKIGVPAGSDAVGLIDDVTGVLVLFPPNSGAGSAALSVVFSGAVEGKPKIGFCSV